MSTYDLSNASTGFRPARVVRAEPDGAQILIEDGGDRRWARPAVSEPTGGWRRGDEILIARSESGDAFIIGILSATRDELRSKSGAVAKRAEDSDAIEVYSPRGELVFAYDAESEKARVHVERGDLELSTADGDIALRSAGAVRVEGQAVDVQAKGAIRFAITSAAKRMSAFVLGSKEARLQAEDISVDAQRGRARVDDARVEGSKLRTAYREIQIRAERCVSTVGTVVENAKNVYRKVSSLVQTEAGRVRTLVKGTFFQKAKNTLLKSDKDHKVRADKIHLG